MSISAQIEEIALLGTCELVKKSHTINSQFLHPADSFRQSYTYHKLLEGPKL